MRLWLVLGPLLLAGCKTMGTSRLAGMDGACNDVVSEVASRHVSVLNQGTTGTPVVQNVTVGEELACVQLHDEESVYAVDVPIQKSGDGTCTVKGELKDRDPPRCT